MKTVVISCGSGVATSTIIYGGVESLLKKSGIPYNLVQCSFTELQSHVGQADLIVSSMNLTQDYGVPKLVGLPYLTGMGVDQLNEKIIKILKEER